MSAWAGPKEDLQSPVVNVRVRAVVLLGEQKNVENVPALVAALGDLVAEMEKPERESFASSLEQLATLLESDAAVARA